MKVTGGARDEGMLSSSSPTSIPRCSYPLCNYSLCEVHEKNCRLHGTEERTDRLHARIAAKCIPVDDTKLSTHANIGLNVKWEQAKGGRDELGGNVLLLKRSMAL
ncbi:hypothetical protein POVCU2_0050270 [Plasmodium ovale curtisi]|uniref:Uncharacterized protein n=1 Tax=Plasmodium ovale curtisi TaxID=864141 RepID=A0A1A8W700_PLAOA|nr:hypothetical protein POVCU2_0050270 [Plasmodium ovale curtisi]SBS98495.1 hypothetical protein POVCU1_046550 [Plasmodium ovale curtisi]